MWLLFDSAGGRCFDLELVKMKMKPDASDDGEAGLVVTVCCRWEDFG